MTKTIYVIERQWGQKKAWTTEPLVYLVPQHAVRALLKLRAKIYPPGWAKFSYRIVPYSRSL